MGKKKEKKVQGGSEDGLGTEISLGKGKSGRGAPERNIEHGNFGGKKTQRSRRLEPNIRISEKAYRRWKRRKSGPNRGKENNAIGGAYRRSKMKNSLMFQKWGENGSERS